MASGCARNLLRRVYFLACATLENLLLKLQSLQTFLETCFLQRSLPHLGSCIGTKDKLYKCYLLISCSLLCTDQSGHQLPSRVLEYRRPAGRMAWVRDPGAAFLCFISCTTSSSSTWCPHHQVSQLVCRWNLST